MAALEAFMAGMVMMGFMVAGLFFFRFWSRTRERLFAIFGVAFFLMALNEVFVDVTSPTNELVFAYVLRIIAYLMLIVAIVVKNLEEAKTTKS
jgi:DNA segregation ATPase FtsK/SpoIIIE-like protein